MLWLFEYSSYSTYLPTTTCLVTNQQFSAYKCRLDVVLLFALKTLALALSFSAFLDYSRPSCACYKAPRSAKKDSYWFLHVLYRYMVYYAYIHTYIHTYCIWACGDIYSYYSRHVTTNINKILKYSHQTHDYDYVYESKNE